jgi:hypothetical protein
MKKVLSIALVSALVCSSALAAAGNDGTQLQYLTEFTAENYCPTSFVFHSNGTNDPIHGTLTASKSGKQFHSTYNNLPWPGGSMGPEGNIGSASHNVGAYGYGRNYVGYVNKSTGVVGCFYSYTPPSTNKFVDMTMVSQ